MGSRLVFEDSIDHVLGIWSEGKTYHRYYFIGDQPWEWYKLQI